MIIYNYRTLHYIIVNYLNLIINNIVLLNLKNNLIFLIKSGEGTGPFETAATETVNFNLSLKFNLFGANSRRNVAFMLQ